MKRRHFYPSSMPLVLLMMLSGCTTYVGQKIGPDGEFPSAPDKLTGQRKPITGGIPFTLTKPEYTVTITVDPSDATKAIYALSVGYVPDASQRFTIALDPGLLVNGKFELELGDKGSPTSATATTSTRVVETFSAVVGVAVKAIGAGLLDAAGTLDIYRAQVEASTDSRCKAIGAGSSGRTAGQSIADVIDGLRGEAEREIADGAKADSARAEWVGERLHYETDAQRSCMAAVAQEIKTRQEDPAEQAWTKARDALDEAAESSAELALLRTQIKAKVAALDVDALQKTDDGLVGKGLNEARTAAQQGRSFVQARLASRFARWLLNMQPDIWRARHLGHLEREIARCRAESLLPSSTQKCDDTEGRASLSNLQLQRALTLGEPELLDRLERIDALLAQVQTSEGERSARQGAVDEHIKLREERDRLQARIDQVRTDTLGKNRSVALAADAAKPDKVQPRAAVPVALVEKGYVEAVNAKPSAYKTAREFVLVLEPDNTGAITPIPSP